MRKLLLHLAPVLAILVLANTASAATRAAADTDGSYGPRLEGFAYPWPVMQYQFRSQGQALEMAYMDIRPERPNGRIALLLHGKNFCAATWQPTIRVLSAANRPGSRQTYCAGLRCND